MKPKPNLDRFTHDWWNEKPHHEPVEEPEGITAPAEIREFNERCGYSFGEFGEYSEDSIRRMAEIASLRGFKDLEKKLLETLT